MADPIRPDQPSEALKAFGELCITLCAVFGEVKSWPQEVHAAAEKVGSALSAAPVAEPPQEEKAAVTAMADDWLRSTPRERAARRMQATPLIAALLKALGDPAVLQPASALPMQGGWHISAEDVAEGGAYGYAVLDANDVIVADHCSLANAQEIVRLRAASALEDRETTKTKI